MYKTFEVEHFRCFDRLALDGLKRVNLIGGANDVGKTAVLEAMFLHTGGTNPELANTVDALRGMAKKKVLLASWSESPWIHLFHGFDISHPITLRGSDDAGKVRVVKLEVVRGAQLRPAERGAPQREIVFDSAPVSPTTEAGAHGIRLRYKDGPEEGVIDLILDKSGFRLDPVPPPPPFPGFILSARGGASLAEDAEKFSRLAVCGKDTLLVEALKVIEPRVTRLSLLMVGGDTVIHGEIGLGRLIPLPVMGAGVTRLATMILAIADNRNGVVCIDEIENGIHHTALERVWAVIAQAAELFQCQVFATTHSWECVVAAHRAFSARDPYDFRLLRLERDEKLDSIHAVAYDKETLSTAIDEGLEVR